MTRYGHAQVLGFSEDTQEVCEKERTTLGKAGVDVDVVLAQIQMLHEQTVALNAQQEALKRQLRQTTETYTRTLQSLYVVCSGALDMAIAAMRKDSPAAKNLQRLRSRIRRPRKAEEVVPVQAGTT